MFNEKRLDQIRRLVAMLEEADPPGSGGQTTASTGHRGERSIRERPGPFQAASALRGGEEGAASQHFGVPAAGPGV